MKLYKYYLVELFIKKYMLYLIDILQVKFNKNILKSDYGSNPELGAKVVMTVNTV